MGKVENNKAFFVQRLGAFLIDMFIVTFLASLIAVPFSSINKNDNTEEKIIELMEQYQNPEIVDDDFVAQMTDLYYQSARSSGLISLITIGVYLLYFVVYQMRKKGQTIGKKLMKIRVVSDVGELNMNQLLFRAFIADFILVELISFILMLFASKSSYIYSVFLVESIQYLIVVISIFMIMNKRDGRAIHDKIAKTTVIRV